MEAAPLTAIHCAVQTVRRLSETAPPGAAYPRHLAEMALRVFGIPELALELLRSGRSDEATVAELSAAFREAVLGRILEIEILSCGGHGIREVKHALGELSLLLSGCPATLGQSAHAFDELAKNPRLKLLIKTLPRDLLREE